MVKSCSAYGCKNRWNSKCKRQYHIFPLSNPKLLTQWVAALRRASWMPTKTSYLCSDHFTSDCYKSEAKKYLKKDAVPTLFNFNDPKKAFGAKHSLTEHPYITRLSPCPESISVGEEEDAPSTSNSSPIENFPDMYDSAEHENVNNNCTESSTSRVTKAGKSPSKVSLIRKVKILQRKLKQRDEKIKNLQTLLNAALCDIADDNTAALLGNSFEKLPLNLLLNLVKKSAKYNNKTGFSLPYVKL